MFLSLDVGTTVAKCVLFDKSGQEKFIHEKSFCLITKEDGTAEQDPLEIKIAIIECLKKVFETEWKSKVKAICISTQGGSFIPIRKDGTPTNNLITWMDTRANSIVNNWSSTEISQIIRKKSGWWVESGLPLATIEWFRLNQEKKFKETDYFLSLNDYIVFLLTDNLVTNPSCAGEMLLVNSQTGEYDEWLCELVGIKAENLSDIKPADEIVGSLNNEIQEICNIDFTVPVINGGQDHTLEALAVGLADSGKALLACGTAWVINSVAKKENISLVPPNMGENFHILPNQWNISQYIGCFGGVMEWWTQQMWQNVEGSLNRSDIYRIMNEKMKDSSDRTNEIFAFPLSGGKQLDLQRDSTFFDGVKLSHTREQLTLALMEGCAFEVKWALDNLAKHNLPIKEMWMIGGATRSSVWPKILADLLGIPIYISNYSHGPALGAAMICAVKYGDFKDYEECREVFKVSSLKIDPDKKKNEELLIKYEKFKEKSSHISRK